VLNGCPVADLDAARIASVLRPKIAGALVLDQVTAGLELDFFVCFSSGSSVWGSKDLAHYAAGNRFLDSFTAWRRAKGRAATCVNWGAWEGDGMASAEDKTAWAAVGVQALSRPEALEAMGRLIAASVGQAVVAQIDWSVFKPVYEARGRRPLLDEIKVGGNNPAAGITQSNTHERGRMAGKIAELASSERLEFLRRHLREQVAHALGLANFDALDPDRGFFEMGMDSMMAVAMNRKLEDDFACTLPRTVTFDYPTVNALAGLLATILAGSPARGVSAAAVPARVETRAKPASFSQASGAELEAMLARKLAALREKRV
jgi:acyl carrier protein